MFINHDEAKKCETWSSYYPLVKYAKKCFRGYDRVSINKRAEKESSQGVLKIPMTQKLEKTEIYYIICLSCFHYIIRYAMKLLLGSKNNKCRIQDLCTFLCNWCLLFWLKYVLRIINNLGHFITVFQQMFLVTPGFDFLKNTFLKKKCVSMTLTKKCASRWL